MLLAKTIYLSVDGTGGVASNGIAAWSFSVIAEFQDGAQAFGGFMSGLVGLSESQHWIGADSKSAGSAEMSAQVWAVMWVMQYFSSLNGPHVVILFDSCYAAAIATAKATPRIQLRLAAILSGLAMALQEQTRVSFHHIKSHDGHPWNELADAGANAASTGLYSTPICTPACI